MAVHDATTIARRVANLYEQSAKLRRDPSYAPKAVAAGLIDKAANAVELLVKDVVPISNDAERNAAQYQPLDALLTVTERFMMLVVNFPDQ